MKPFKLHLSSKADLVTTYEQIRAGFVSLALERSRRATPFVQQARALKTEASRASAPTDLLKIQKIRQSLLCAAGVSDKAAGHMQDEDMTEAIRGLITKYLEPAGNAFVEELVFRFLLTRGDTLGGSMRNVGGALAQRKMTRAIIAALTLNGSSYTWLHATSRVWTPMTKDDADIELSVAGLSWGAKGKARTILYNRNVPLAKKNVDMSILNCIPDKAESACKDPAAYIAFGELKGGIDPAGADEHWKTASAHLTRIREAFAKKHLTPVAFFVGAAIEKSMSDEIWSQLESGLLANAANLNDPGQVASLCSWICTL